MATTTRSTTATASPPRTRTSNSEVLVRLETRRRLIAAFIAERGGLLPTLRAIQALLKQVGSCVSRRTVQTDLRSLGLLGG